jgi:hypothetical protein
MGGSARFGRAAGPQLKPVMEAIASRVNQVTSKAQAEGRRFSGISIHRQLLEEGYTVGVNSVYVYLRSRKRVRSRMPSRAGAVST